MMPTIERRNRVFIGGIGDRITKEEIESQFSRFGKLTNVWVAQNPPGFAFVEYDHISEADLAVSEMNGKSFMGSGNKIRVEHSHGGRSRRRGPGGFSQSRSFSPRSSNGGRDRFRGSSPSYRSNGSGGFRREGGSFGGGPGGRFDGGDRRRPFPSGGGPSGRFQSGGQPRYGRYERSYGGGRRSRSPIGPVGARRYDCHI
ncbi:hypothetical protein SSS_07242 [Sarcoptes scabiei]|uniref:RNA-binding protein Rsf1 n=1 Tax=Sarcoptes scabiei TaxID=52283 RepID=A0A834R1T3_SARSC|nr:hypothetical protein SSS_07242 [Sarcoptes scabiei]